MNLEEPLGFVEIRWFKRGRGAWLGAALNKGACPAWKLYGTTCLKVPPPDATWYPSLVTHCHGGFTKLGKFAAPIYQ